MANRLSGLLEEPNRLEGILDTEPVFDPVAEEERIKASVDMSEETTLSIVDTHIHHEQLVEKPEKQLQAPMQIGPTPTPTRWQKFKKFFIGDRPPLPPDADRIEKLSRAFDIGATLPLRAFLKFGKGLTLNTADLMWAAIKRMTPKDIWVDEVRDMNLDEAMDWAGGYNPSGFQKSVGEIGEFVGRLRTVAPIAQKLGIIGNTPKDISVLAKAGETAKLFGTAAVGEQVAKLAAEKIDPTEAEFGFEGPKAVLRDMAIGAVLSIARSGIKGVWSKLTPSEQVRALKTLGLKKGATPEEITVASRKMALKFHPDKAKGFEEEFKKVIKARNLLREGEPQDVVFRGAKVTISPKVLPSEVAKPIVKAAKPPVKAPTELAKPIKPAEAPITAPKAEIEAPAAEVDIVEGRQRVRQMTQANMEVLDDNVEKCPRCTNETLEAFGIRKTEPVIGGLGVRKAFNDNGFDLHLVQDEDVFAENPRLDKFIEEHPKGSFYIMTSQHAMALINGELTDFAEGTGRRKVVGAFEILPKPTQPPKAAEVRKRDILGGVDPIFQINKALKEAVEIRPKVEKERKIELRKRVGAAAGALKSSLAKRKISAEESIGRSTGLLKGPLSNARFSSIRDIMEDALPGAVDIAFRSIGESKTLKYFEIIETKEAFAKLIDGIPITLRQVDMIKKHFGVEMGEIARSRAEKSSLSDRAFALWRAGLLTGLKTSGLNTMSNLTHALTETAKDVIAAPVDILVKQFTGKREVGFTFKGIPKGIKEGVIKGWEYLWTGISERDIGKKLDYVPVNFGESKLGKVKQVYVETVFHLMGAEDQPFFYGAMSRAIQSQAIARGRNEGLKGKELKDFVEKTRKTPTQDMLENAMHDAEMAVFQNRTVLGDIASHIQKAPVIRWTVPFSRTPSAVAMQIINYTPIGAFKEVVAQIHKGEFNQRNFSHAIGRSVVGTPALAIGALLLAKGLMTLDFPEGERERKLWELEGKKPFAIKIDDKWRSIFVLGPVGNVLIIGAYFQKALEESGSPSEAIVTALSGGGKSFSEQTFVIGMSRAIDAIKDPERSFDRFFTGMAGSFVPTIVADVARATDYTERTYKGPWQGIVNRIPVARTTLEERLDVFGQDLPRYGGNPLEVMIDASRPVKIRQDVVVDELRRLWNKNVRVAPTKLGNRDGYKSLTQEENTVLWRRAGEATYQGLFELIQRGSYKRKGDEAKGKMIEKVVKAAKDDARAEATEIKLNQGVTMLELKESGLVTSDVEPLIRR